MRIGNHCVAVGTSHGLRRDRSSRAKHMLVLTFLGLIACAEPLEVISILAELRTDRSSYEMGQQGILYFRVDHEWSVALGCGLLMQRRVAGRWFDVDILAEVCPLSGQTQQWPFQVSSGLFAPGGEYRFAIRFKNQFSTSYRFSNTFSITESQGAEEIIALSPTASSASPRRCARAGGLADSGSTTCSPHARPSTCL